MLAPSKLDRPTRLLVLAAGLVIMGSLAACGSTSAVPVTGVRLDHSTLNLAVGGPSATLLATVSPSDATSPAVTWTSTNPSVATVSATGVVAPVAIGATTIRVTTSDGGMTATCAVTVVPHAVAATGVTLDKTTLELVLGAPAGQLTATVAPADATDVYVTWSSSDESVARVSATGGVTAVAPGTATITVKTADGSFTATCAVTVAPPPTIPLTTGTDTLTAVAGTQTFTATLGGGSPTLTANDSLHGSGNSLQITDSSGPASQDLIPGGVALAGIPAVTLTTSGNAGAGAASPFDLSGLSGITRFTLDASGAQGDYLKVGSGVALAIQTASAEVGVLGGFASLTLGDVNLTALTLTGSAGPVSLTAATGPATLTVNAADLHLTGGLTDSGHHVTSLTVAGTGSSTIDTLAGSALTHLTIAGSVTLGSSGRFAALPSSLTTIDLSADDAAQYLTLQSSGATLSAGRGDVALTDGHGGNTIGLGNGNNTLLVSGATADVITVGDGNNAFIDGSSGGGHQVTFGTGLNSADLGHHTNVLTVGAHGGYATAPTTPNLVVRNIGAGDRVALSSLSVLHVEFIPGLLGQGGSAAGTIAGLESALITNHPGASAFALDIYGGDTFIVASASGGTLGATDTTIIQLVGYTGTVSWSGTDNLLHLN